MATGSTLNYAGIIANNIVNNVAVPGVLDVGPMGASTSVPLVGPSVSFNGTLSLTGINTYTGVTHDNFGTLEIAQDANLGAVPASVTANSLTIGTPYNVADPISGSGATLLLNGTFQISTNRGIGLGVAYVSTPATTTGSGFTLPPAPTAGGEIDVVSGDTVTYNGVITNTSLSSPLATLNDPLVVNSASHTGTLVLGGTDTYGLNSSTAWPSTTIDGGTLSISSASALSFAPLSAQKAVINIDGGTLLLTGIVPITLPANSGMTVGYGGTSPGGTGEIDVATGQTVTYNGIITNGITNGQGGAGSGTSELVVGNSGQTNNGELILGGANVYGGGTLINTGTVLFNQASSIGGNPANVPTTDVTVESTGTAAAGYAMDQTSFLDRIATGSTGVVALGADDSLPLDFSAATGANLPSVSFGDIPGSGAPPVRSLTRAPLTPYGTTYYLGGGGGKLTVSSAWQTLRLDRQGSFCAQWHRSRHGGPDEHEHLQRGDIGRWRPPQRQRQYRRHRSHRLLGCNSGRHRHHHLPGDGQPRRHHRAGDSPTSTGILTTDLAINGTLSAYLNGTTAGTGYDQIQATGAAVSAGRSSILSLVVGPNFTAAPPAPGTIFDLLVNGPGSVLTAFSAMPPGSIITDSTNKYQFKISYTGTNSGTTGGNDVVVDYLGTTVTCISPTYGLTGASVTITGTNFTGTSAVSFGGTPATSFVVNSVSSITAVAPAGIDTVNVTVTTPGGTSAISTNDRSACSRS